MPESGSADYRPVAATCSLAADIPAPSEDGFDHRGAAHTGVDHHVVEPAVGPVAIVIPGNVGFAAAVGSLELCPGVSSVLRKVLFKPANLTGHRRVYENIKDARER